MRVPFLFLVSFMAATANPPPAGDGWAAVVSKGSFGEFDAGASGFAVAMRDSPSKIIRRDCGSCDIKEAKTVYYKRLTPLPPFDLLGVLKSNWTLMPGNAFNVDFELYSSLADAQAGVAGKRWKYCNGDDASGVGAFRDCGPAGAMTDQWNSFSGRGGQSDVLFAVATGAKPGPPPPVPAPPTPAPGPFPGPELLHPKIHFTPPYVSMSGGWHDIAGAITHNGVHHIYQGTGWNHAFR